MKSFIKGLMTDGKTINIKKYLNGARRFQIIPTAVGIPQIIRVSDMIEGTLNLLVKIILK